MRALITTCRDGSVDLSVIADALGNREFEIISNLCDDRRSRGVLLYGSYARGTAGPYSDIDVLHVVSDRPRPYACGTINVTEYLPSHLAKMARAGSLFALHLTVEGRVICDPYGELAALRGLMAPRRTYSDLKAQLSSLTPLIDPRLDDADRYLEGLTRIGIYLLRSVAYIACIEGGFLTFDLDRVVQFLGDDELAQALRARKRQVLTMSDLALTSQALRKYLPSEDVGRYNSVEQFAVSKADDPFASALVLNVIAGGRDIPYTSLALPPL